MPLIAVDEETKQALDKIGVELATIRGTKSVTYEAIVYTLVELWEKQQEVKTS